MSYTPPAGTAVDFTFLSGETYTPPAGNALVFDFREIPKLRASGVLALSGSATLTHYVKIEGAGEFAPLSGEASVLTASMLFARDGLRLSGAAEFNAEPVFVGAGGIALVGVAVFGATPVFFVNSQYSLRGQAVLMAEQRLTGEGCVALGGLASFVVHTPANLSLAGKFAPLGGLASIRAEPSVFASGHGPRLSGGATFNHGSVLTVAGKLAALGGSASLRRGQAVSASGGIKLSGSAQLRMGNALLVVGSYTLGGSATLAYRSPYTMTVSGPVGLGGLARFDTTFDLPPDSILVLQSQHSVFVVERDGLH